MRALGTQQKTKRHHAAPSLALVFVLALCAVRTFSIEVRQASTEEAKAGWVHCFATLTIWPTNILPTTTNSPFVIGVLGDDAVMGELEKLARTNLVYQHRITVKKIETEQDAEGCHELYVGASGLKIWPRIRNRLQDASVLTVGDADQFPDAMIQFVQVPRPGNKKTLRYVVKMAAVQRARLTPRGYLLQNAKEVLGSP